VYIINYYKSTRVLQLEPYYECAFKCVDTVIHEDIQDFPLATELQKIENVR